VKAVEQGWFPEIAPPHVPSESLYGTCLDIYQRTNETNVIVHSYPWGDPAYWRGPLVNESDTLTTRSPNEEMKIDHHYLSGLKSQIGMIALGILFFIGVRRFQTCKHSKKWHYTEIQT
jgi:hypothetical protein